jgi:hypothetical protein
MPRLYTVTFDNVTLTNSGGDADIFEITPARDKPLEILSIELGSQEIKDAEEEQIRLKLIRGHTTSGSTPSATPTPRPISPIDTAAGFTAEVNNATIASAGTAVDLWSNTWNVRAPGPIFPPMPQGYGYWVGTASTQELLVLRCMSTVLDDVVLNGTVLICEYP